MKRILIFLLFISLLQSGYAQIIRGIILDKSNDAKIGYATVYFDGTFVGTNSDQNGNFELDISKYNSMPLTISALGYNRITIADFEKNEPLVIYLTPKFFELKEVVINSKKYSKERVENLAIFRKVFLGDTENGRNCLIMNEKDISFSYDAAGDTLKAFAQKPLLIVNKKLGYTITYFLNKFEYCKQDKYFIYDGNSIFKKDSTGGIAQRQAFERRRRYAYIGSRMQFFRELWKKDIDDSGFRIINSFDELLSFNDVVKTKDDQKKFFSYNGPLIISYYRRGESSYVKFLKKEVFFDQNGYSDPSGILWKGQMSKLRVGDMLPYEYAGIYKLN